MQLPQCKRAVQAAVRITKTELQPPRVRAERSVAPARRVASYVGLSLRIDRVGGTASIVTVKALAKSA